MGVEGGLWDVFFEKRALSLEGVRTTGWEVSWWFMVRESGEVLTSGAVTASFESG